MDGFSEYLQTTWNRMRSIRSPTELVDYTLKHCVSLSTDWKDHHNAAELLMGAWEQLFNLDNVRPGEFADRIRELPNYDEMLKQSFFVHWMDKTLGQSPETPIHIDESDIDRLETLNNVGDGGRVPLSLSIPLLTGHLTKVRYVELSRTAYKDVTQTTQGLGGVVALADTNAEVQGYNPRNIKSGERPRVLFRNSAALHLEELKTAETLPVLAKAGTITIIDVQLG